MKIIFFGDSITEGMPGESFFNIVEKQQPDHELTNQGCGGDTIITLYYRIQYFRLKESADISFVWVGVNDVWGEYLGNYENWDDMVAEVKEYYRKILGILCKYSKKVVSVSPLFIGEDLENEWNDKLDEITNVISDVSGEYDTCDFFNIREAFLETAKVHFENKSSPEELLFTIDGVHLNDFGAELVAEIFIDYINKLQA